MVDQKQRQIDLRRALEDNQIVPYFQPLVELRTGVITGFDVATPPRASALLHKDDLTRERLAFAIRRASRAAR